MSTVVQALATAMTEIDELARSFGLDPFPMRYELCPAETLHTIAAYGMPTRFQHWSFGKQYRRLRLQHELGWGKIFELVINSNPCCAYLLESNSLLENKLITAHVIAHSDFFKNNIYFDRTNRDMLSSMNALAERIRDYETRYGLDAVEAFLDAALAVQEHVDPSHYGREKRRHGNVETPESDVMWFIARQSRTLTDWQRDLLASLHEEMLYFRPQIDTKIMNEGWANVSKRNHETGNSN
jgi:stage V sporulation protein R